MGFPTSIINHPTDIEPQNGEALLWKVEALASQTAIAMCEDIKRTETFTALSKLISAETAIVYFEKRVREELYATIRDLCSIAWSIDSTTDKNTRITLETRHDLANLLKQHWPSNSIPLKIDKSFISRGVRTELGNQTVKGFRQAAKKCIILGKNFWNRSLPPSMPENTVAVHYTDEGIEENSRSDLFWYHHRYVDPRQILVFFENISVKSKTTLAKDISILESQNIRGVSLDNGRIQGKPLPYWKNNRKSKTLFKAFTHAKHPHSTGSEKWILRMSKSLLAQVDYWADFYSYFNIKVHIDTEEGSIRGVCQRIALDNIGGIRVGKQRSENLGWNQSMLGFHPHHVFFMWCNRSIDDLENGHNGIKNLVISGYPFDYLFNNTKSSDQWKTYLTDNSATYIIALFDEVFYEPIQNKRKIAHSLTNNAESEYRISLVSGIINDIPYSKIMLSEFYKAFLNLVIDNTDVGIIIKSKKPDILPRLTELDSILKQALDTHRCIIVDNPQKQLPVYASNASDISIGIGISTAITETIISGGVGLHYDCTSMIRHPFYQFGYNQIVFNDLKTLLEAITNHKNRTPQTSSSFDFTTLPNRFDPFRDGQSSDRIERYISDLLESFEHGGNQHDAINLANARYADLWGQDKIISSSERTEYTYHE